MNNLLLTLGAILVGILAALVAVPMVIDWNGYRGVFEEEASRMLGRDVRVGGGVALRILPVPYVRFEKLRIADTATTGGDPLFRAESVTMQLSIAPLLRGVIEARSVELKKPFLRLAVDAQGQGNWATLSIKPGSLPFVPADIALQAVGIEQGLLVLVDGAGREVANFEAIDGELSADGIEGPFKFKGTSAWAGQSREVRLSSAKAEADGATRVRAFVRVPENQNAYTFDGRLLDLKGHPRFDGDLTAKLPFASAPAASKARQPVQPGALPSEGFEFKARLEGDLNGATVRDIALSLEQTGDPQLITGDAKLVWGSTLAFETVLATKSLNLDAIARSTTKDPLDVVRGALDTVLSALPGQAQTDARLKADRVTLAGDTANNLTVAVSRTGTTLALKELRADLPGSTRIDVVGELRKEAGPWTFEGPVSLNGGNLARFMAWTQGGHPTKAQPSRAANGYEGAFSLASRVALSAKTLALTRFVATFGGPPVNGSFAMSLEGRRRIDATLDGSQIDTGRLWPEGFDPAAVRAFLNIERKPPVASSERIGVGVFGFDPQLTDLHLDVRAGEWRANATTLVRNLDTSLTVERGHLSIARLRFNTPNGLELDVDGTLDHVGGGGGIDASDKVDKVLKGELPPARGLLHYVVGTPTPAAANDLFALIDWPSPESPIAGKLTALGPARLAGVLVLGDRNATSRDVTIDGSIDGGRIETSAKFDAGFADWRKGGLDLTATIDARDLNRWLSLADMAVMAPMQPRAGQISLKASGQPETGLTAFATLVSDDASVAYQGLVGLPASGAPVLDGAAGIVARDVAEVLALAGVTIGKGRDDKAVQGQVTVKQSAGQLTLATTALTLDQSRVSGTLAVTKPAPGQPSEIKAEVAMDKASFSSLLAMVADRRETGSLLSARSDPPQADMALKIGRLSLQPGIDITDLTASLNLTPGKTALSNIEGSVLGGQLKGNGDIIKSSIGLTATLAGQVLNAKLGPTLPITIDVKAKSQGASSDNLLVGLEGSGNATLGPGQVALVDPAGVGRIVEQSLALKTAPTGEVLAAQVRNSLATTPLSLPTRTAPFSLAGGVAKLASVAFPTREGRATLETTFDISSGGFATTWALEAEAKPGVTGKPKAPLPPVIVALTGQVATLAQSRETIELTAFGNELALRKLERDAEELERLAKIEEEQRLTAKAEAEAARTANDAAAAAATQPVTQPASGKVEPAAGIPPTIQVPMPIEGIKDQPPPQPTVPGQRVNQAAPTGLPQPFQNNF